MLASTSLPLCTPPAPLPPPKLQLPRRIFRSPHRLPAPESPRRSAGALGPVEAPSGPSRSAPLARGRVQCAGFWDRSHRSVDERRLEPFWMLIIKDTIRSLRSLVLFLYEQPGQLKYIEWPGFQNTLRTALLTLIIVALLIVALSSIDSVLSFLLAAFLRRKG